MRYAKVSGNCFVIIHCYIFPNAHDINCLENKSNHLKRKGVRFEEIGIEYLSAGKYDTLIIPNVVYV